MTYRELLSFADELGERFPNLLDSEIILSCSKFFGRDFDRNSPIGRACIRSYDFGASKGEYLLGEIYGVNLD